VKIVSYERARDLVRQEPVLFAEIVGEAPDAQSLELHVMQRSGTALYEAERTDTGPVPKDSVHGLVSEVAAARHVRYAAIYRAGEHWPPPPWTSAGRIGGLGRNVGGADRALRAVAGTLLLAAALSGSTSGSTRAVLLAISGIALATALTRFCPLNAALGIDTRHLGPMR
jgi:hypothetical protein